jgi:hypothetical protein
VTGWRNSRLTSYSKLLELNEANTKFITLRRCGRKLLEEVEAIEDWNWIHIPHPRRKHPNPLVHESRVHLRGYAGELPPPDICPVDRRYPGRPPIRVTVPRPEALS